MRFRKPNAQITVIAGKSDTALEAIFKWNSFTNLCMKYHVTVVSSDGAEMVVSGRPKKIEKFRQAHARLAKMGAV